MEERLIAAVAELVEKINQGGDFAIAQAPDVLQQFLLMERVYFLLTLPSAWQCSFFVSERWGGSGLPPKYAKRKEIDGWMMKNLNILLVGGSVEALRRSQH